MTNEEELKLLEVIEVNENEDWSINFWKCTNNIEKELLVLIENHKDNDLDTLFPDGFYNEMMRQIRYFNKHRIRVDGTTPGIVEYFGSIEKTMEWAINA